MFNFSWGPRSRISRICACQDVARQAIFRYARCIMPPGTGPALKNALGIAGRARCARRTCQPAPTDDGYLFDVVRADLLEKTSIGFRDSGPVAPDEPLQSTNGNGQVKFSAATGWFTGMTADAAANRGKRVGHPGVTVGISYFPRQSATHNAPPGMHGTRLHAGKIRFQPIQIN